MRKCMIALLAFVFIGSVLAQNDRIEYNGQEIFLNGANLAWVDFARDIGPGETDFEEFGKLFKEMHDYGANSVRFWLHTTGVVTPEFTADTVSGPGVGAIDDLKQILDSAYAYDIAVLLSLWSHDMLRLNIGEPWITQNQALIQDTNVLQTYIDHALIPMVDSTKDHPALLAWEIFNEPEGCIEGVPDGGWGGRAFVSREEVSRAVNRMAGAIHRVDTNLLVTNGTHTLTSNSDRGLENYYSDDALYDAGGDTLGYLDFYQVHYYSQDLNPFDNPCSYWNLDKPLIIGEFYPGCDVCGDFSNHEYLLNNGYAGAMGWMWDEPGHGEDIKQELQYTFLNHTAEVDIDNMLGDAPFLVFSGPEYGAELESGSDVSFSATAEDTDGSIVNVEFMLVREVEMDSVLISLTEAPYNYTITGAEDGVYQVYARAVDNDGNTKTSSPIAFTIGEPPIYRYEAENADLTGGADVQTDALASGGEFVNFTSDASIKWNVLGCPADGTYDMIIGFGVPYGSKNNFIIINDDVAGQLDILFEGSDSEWLRDTIPVDLVEGANTVEIVDSWGWMTFDFIEFPFERPPKVSEIIISSETGDFLIDEPGGTLQMTATVLPEDAGLKTLRWTVNNPAVAAIDEESGLLTAQKDGTVRVFAWATDNSGVKAEADVAVSNQPDAIAELSGVRSEVYPNPATSELYYRSTHKVAALKVYSIQGQLIREYNGNNENSIDISSLETGLYYLSIQNTDGKIENYCFVKQ